MGRISRLWPFKSEEEDDFYYEDEQILTIGSIYEISGPTRKRPFSRKRAEEKPTFGFGRVLDE